MSEDGWKKLQDGIRDLLAGDGVTVPVKGTYLVTDGVVRAVSSVTPSGAVRCAYVEFKREGE